MLTAIRVSDTDSASAGQKPDRQPHTKRGHLNQGVSRRRSAPVVFWIATGLVWCALLGAGQRLEAQVRFGTVVGNVTDASGNSVAGANVTLTSLGTSEM